ncbi:MAG TPA: YhcN/YlaJ family sporulation lipoprotein [Candidatus Bathyarchaeia archaeon]|nr:YhcN/YlaJ family sporulation lipoprotein [Candidatus Bathyarchaeia archaeon]
MKKLLYPLSLVMLVAAMTACGNNNATGNNGIADRGAQTQNAYDQANRLGNQTPTNTRGNYSNTGTLGTNYGAQNYGTTNNQGTANGYNRVLADRLATAADRVPGVDGATAIVYGNDVVIGVNTRFGTMNDTRQRNVVEQQVRAEARAIAPRMNIRVTSDQQMMTRIRNLDNSFRGGVGVSNGAGTNMNHNGIANGRGNGFGTTAGNGDMGGNGVAGYGTGNRTGVTGGPATVPGNLSTARYDFAELFRDLGRTITAPVR